MKKLISCIIVLSVLFSFSACEKDTDDPPVVESYFLYQGTKYELDTGFDLKDIGGNSTTHEIYLTESAVGYNTFLEDIIGTGYGIKLVIESDQSDSFFYSDIKIDTLNSTIEPGEIKSGWITLDYDFFMIDGTRFGFEHGGVQMVKNGEEYNIKGEFVTVDGEAVSLDFNGTIPQYIDNR